MIGNVLLGIDCVELVWLGVCNFCNVGVNFVFDNDLEGYIF